MIVPVFVDTNVFVYRFDTTEPDKHRRCAEWLDQLWADRSGRVSRQVQHELYTTLSRKLAMPRNEARRVVASLEAWRPLIPGRDDQEAAWRLEDRFALAWWDALIVASAQRCGARVLLTEDLQHGQDFDGLRVVNPFRASPDDGLAVHDDQPTYG
jgi:predicted nucleic acid-binding protein